MLCFKVVLTLIMVAGVMLRRNRVLNDQAGWGGFVTIVSGGSRDLVKTKLRKLLVKLLLTIFVRVLSTETSKCNWFTHQARMFHMLVSEGQTLVFARTGCISAEIIDHLGVGMAGAGKNDTQFIVC